MRHLLLVILALFPALAASAQPADTSLFRGIVTYSVESYADSGSVEHELFKAFAPVMQRVIFGAGGRIRLTEDDGSDTDVIIDLANARYYRLDGDDSVAQKLTRTDYEQYFSPTLLEPMEETETIDGYLCRKYRVVSSQFVRRGAQAYVWVTDEVQMLRERGDYNHEESGFRALFPLPMVLGITEGTPMKTEVTEQGVRVVYTTRLEPGEPADALFTVPAGYRTE